MGKLVCGVGINDADYTVQPTLSGRQDCCPFYKTWKGMIQRCYSKKLQEKYNTYSACFVSEDWLLFSNFKKWMLTQNWVGNHLDKDLLFVGNKIYSQNTCVFIGHITNSFNNDQLASRGEFPIGVCFSKFAGKFESRCRNPFTKKSEHLGYFLCKDAAHLAWKSRKNELACQLADLQTDERVATALRLRYL